MHAGEFKISATEQEVNRIETLLSLLIRATVNRPAQLFEGAVFRIWKLTRTSDESSFQTV